MGAGRTRAFLGLGGNIGEPARAMAAALRDLDSANSLDVVAVSALYQTLPWGKEDQPDFLNAVAEIETRLSPRQLLDRCLEVERALKRERRERWGPRLIDIDVLYFGDRKIAEEGLEIPHPRMLERAFVLVPMEEIAPDLVIAGRTVAQHLEGIERSGINKVTADGSWWQEQSAAG